MYRLLLLALVALGLAPGTLVRTATGARNDVAQVRIVPLGEREGVSGDLRLTGAWELNADHAWFGGFSGLVARGSDSLIAGTDRGFLLDLDLSGNVPRAVPGSFRFVGRSPPGREETVDLEALARDPATGTLWASFENRNLVMRMEPDGRRRFSAPPAIAEWNANMGPETFERLGDGRFLMISEASIKGGRAHHEALLFPGDPVEAATAPPLAFTFVGPTYHEPVDAAQLPDGRILILLRLVAYNIPAEFNAAIMIADPAAIRAGQLWSGRVISRLNGGIFAENFEGIAYVPDPADPTRGGIWVISDDNFSIFQRSLLLRLDWNSAAFPK